MEATTLRVWRTGRPAPAPPALLWSAGAALLAGTTAAVSGWVGVGAVAVLALMVLTAHRPASATYIYLATLPFLAGIDRDRLLPLVRPNEALLVLLIVGVLAGTYVCYLRGAELRVRLRPLDIPLAVFVVLSTLWPLESMLLRGVVPGATDLAAILPICKLAGLLLLVRTTVRTDRQLLALGRVVLWPAGAIACIAVLQTAGFPPVLAAIETLWSTGATGDEVAERGTTTLASSIATGDYIVLALALLIPLSLRDMLGRRERLVLGLVLGAGVLAAGQFSTWAAACAVGFVLLRRNPVLRRYAVRFLPAIAVAALAGAPAFIGRLAQFGDGFGVPRSWLGRWDNLTTFYLPALGDGTFLLGVSPDSVLPAPETWRDVIYLEFGYLQLLWVGGLPLLAAFLWLSVHVLRRSRELADSSGPAAAYASALHAAWWMVLVLSLIDIHLVLRGAGDLLFTFLGVVSGRLGGRRVP